MSDVLDKSEREENLDESLFCDDNDSVFSGEDILVDNDSNEYHEDIPEMEYAELDIFEEPTTNENTLTYKCPNCGAGLVYDAEKQSFVCNFCISEFAEEDLKNSEADKKAKRIEDEEAEFNESVNQYSCPSCGAEIIVDKNTAADFCYYCHNPVVLADKVSGAFKPSKIIPFKIDKDGARRTFLDYAKKKWFCPKDYFSEDRSEMIKGIYYPFWVTDADATARLDATAYKVRSWTSGEYHYTETKKYDVKRGGNIHFEDITTSAISEEDKKMLEGILPYPKDEHIDFSMPYLQGFAAKKRNVERESLSDEVREKMRGYSETLLSDTVIGYTSVNTDFVNMSVNSAHWEYTLMPIWILTYKKGEKTYVYAMNGSTGKIYGELPLSPWKLAILGVAVSAITALIAFLIGGAM
jgi:DNA-directed RNA polymerase subunit RPC12/RpoP